MLHDLATQLYHMGYRYYEKETGVFLSTDPLGQRNAHNGRSGYLFARANPLRYVDPFGLADCDGYWHMVDSGTVQFGGMQSSLAPAFAGVARSRLHVFHLCSMQVGPCVPLFSLLLGLAERDAIRTFTSRDRVPGTEMKISLGRVLRMSGGPLSGKVSTVGILAVAAIVAGSIWLASENRGLSRELYGYRLGMTYEDVKEVGRPIMGEGVVPRPGIRTLKILPGHSLVTGVLLWLYEGEVVKVIVRCGYDEVMEDIGSFNDRLVVLFGEITFMDRDGGNELPLAEYIQRDCGEEENAVAKSMKDDGRTILEVVVEPKASAKSGGHLFVAISDTKVRRSFLPKRKSLAQKETEESP